MAVKGCVGTDFLSRVNHVADIFRSVQNWPLEGHLHFSTSNMGPIEEFHTNIPFWDSVAKMDQHVVSPLEGFFLQMYK